MKKGFKHTLKESIRMLSTYDLPEKSWGIIEHALDVNEEISNQISSLPVYDPNPDAWKNITKPSLVNKSKITLNRIGQIAAAATLILVVSVSLLYRKDKGILIETELVLSENYSVPENESDSEDPIKMIEALCSSGAPVCKTDAFSKKLKLYTELDMELDELKTVIENIGESPEIIRSMIKIENLKSNIFQELILLIHS